MVEPGKGKAAGKSGCISMEKATSILTTTGRRPRGARDVPEPGGAQNLGQIYSGLLAAKRDWRCECSASVGENQTVSKSVY